MNVNWLSKWVPVIALCAATCGAEEPKQDEAPAPPPDPAALLGELGALGLEDKKLDQNLSQLKSQRDALPPRIEKVKSQFDDLNVRWEQATGYCTGTFEEPEYSRRKAECASMEGNLRKEGEAIDAERKSILAQWQRIETQQNQARARKQAIQARSAKILAILAGLERFRDKNANCAKLPSLEAMHQCMQGLWDGARDPGSAVTEGNPNVVVVPNSDGRRRTAEEAIEEYKKSGAANPGPRRPTQNKEVPAPQN